VNDVQPYYFITNTQMVTSGATNIEQYLQRYLTMDTSSRPYSQGWADTFGELSQINLRGVGTNETLILIDGRVAPNVSEFNSAVQPDVNGIPIDAVDHIEILPLSASAIYGGSAVGGVINIVLKKDYAGGSLLYTFANTANSQWNNQSIDLTYGFPAMHDKLHVMIAAHYSDGKPLLVGDRPFVWNREVYAMANDPSAFSYGPYGAALSNATLYPFTYTVTGSGQPANTNASTTVLTLKNGMSLGSNHFYVPAGVGNAGPTAAQMLANAGQYNWVQSQGNNDYAANNYAQYGSRRKDFTATLRYDLTPNIQLFGEFAYEGNIGIESYDGWGSVILPTNSPYNPTQENLYIWLTPFLKSWSGQADVNSANERIITVGAKSKLPFGWNSEIDYTWSQTDAIDRYTYPDTTLMENDLLRGTAPFNPLSDQSITLNAPYILDRYLAPYIINSPSNSNEFAIRLSGPVQLPGGWGSPTVTMGYNHQMVGNPSTVGYQHYPDANVYSNSSYTYYAFGQVQDVDAFYAEIDDLPIVPKKWKVPGIHELSMQLAARGEWYQEKVSQDYVYQYGPLYSIPNYSFGFPALVNGQVVAPQTIDKFTSTNPTIGLKYMPTEDIITRISYGKGFVPPSYTQINPATTQSTAPTQIVDPLTGQTYGVQTVSGGNPNLIPQKSQSWDYGIVFEPKKGPFKGLRLDWEYYSIKQLNVITTPTAQQVINNPGIFAGRVTRNGANGPITSVNITYYNAFEYYTDGWDATVDYRWKTPSAGTFEISGTGTVVEHDKRTYVAGAAAGDLVGWANSGGEAKTKANGTLTWEYKSWTSGWTTRFYDSYKQELQLGDPALYYPGSIYFTLYPTGYLDKYYPASGKTIPYQVYHDFFVKYSFGRRAHSGLTPGIDKLLSGVDVTFGIKDVFNTAPPFDIFASPYYTSTASGDLLLRNYYLSIRKNF
jgi:outer membrane receptor protein involved in Fe transport